MEGIWIVGGSLFFVGVAFMVIYLLLLGIGIAIIKS